VQSVGEVDEPGDVLRVACRSDAHGRGQMTSSSRPILAKASIA
jgi:hypothetical protein